MRREPSKITDLSEKKRRAAAVLRGLGKLFPDPKIALNYRTPWELLVAKFEDYVSASASRRTVEEFEKCVKSCGFYRAKTRSILGAARAVKERFGGKLPRTMAEMVGIPGLGRKSANVILGNAFGVVEGIAVDTHVIRLSRALGLTEHKDPVKIERDLMKIIPRKDWFRTAYLLIDFGRKYCPARSHDHLKHPLGRFFASPRFSAPARTKSRSQRP
ncbi:MAG: Endonuclease III protein [Parcubacteria group bacterium GW2011_GWA1_59_11]|nr:MAG: Endonuclease III protein [Parcubacteria group bacterium GW2011_GWA1_59_11]